MAGYVRAAWRRGNGRNDRESVFRVHTHGWTTRRRRCCLNDRLQLFNKYYTTPWPLCSTTERRMGAASRPCQKNEFVRAPAVTLYYRSAYAVQIGGRYVIKTYMEFYSVPNRVRGVFLLSIRPSRARPVFLRPGRAVTADDVFFVFIFRVVRPIFLRPFNYRYGRT